MTDDELIGTLGTVVVAGALLGMMNNNQNRSNTTRTITKTKYVTRPVKHKFIKSKPIRNKTTTVTKISKQPSLFW
ncbi:hypothetical protein M0R04_08970 [Candidatus Dojkabacteria bacterium]|jgi:hypothetical protein|nr:hypothetical protein [Candidatus Dojkabacteria bacterium]